CMQSLEFPPFTF
nr:immunoglobulin light chain junction region [Macaca mulatta]MOW51495.1 immunoglobulin light chain junction region [Macaca mulatta]MOW51527.1 immunoglobulin light chain junction region [Macaca mulatta]MOW51551.1 immunoglobulin light chain junction region [Macaca mulatta]MOW51595.1 immunoglobulin light chain junction region [Macaca mulatta]